MVIVKINTTLLCLYHTISLMAAVKAHFRCLPINHKSYHSGRSLIITFHETDSAVYHLREVQNQVSRVRFSSHLSVMKVMIKSLSMTNCKISRGMQGLQTLSYGYQSEFYLL